jgi:CHAT domain-containing protein
VFTFVPVHAAGVYDGPSQECCSDYAVSSYTPTVAALLRAQDNARTLNVLESKLSVVAAETTQDANLTKLPSVRREIAHVLHSAREAQISVDEECMTTSVTTAQVPILFKSSQFVHVACHGIQDPNGPLKSSFCVSNGNVTVVELINLELKNAFLAFLSACETAKGHRDQPDETIHLAATMLFVGFKSVVCTLWYVSHLRESIL